MHRAPTSLRLSQPHASGFQWASSPAQSMSSFKPSASGLVQVPARRLQAALYWELRMMLVNKLPHLLAGTLSMTSPLAVRRCRLFCSIAPSWHVCGVTGMVCKLREIVGRRPCMQTHNSGLLFRPHMHACRQVFFQLASPWTATLVSARLLNGAIHLQMQFHLLACAS